MQSSWVVQFVIAEASGQHRENVRPLVAPGTLTNHGLDCIEAGVIGVGGGKQSRPHPLAGRSLTPTGPDKLGTCSVAGCLLHEQLPALAHERMGHATQVCQVVVRPIAKLAEGFVHRRAPLTLAWVCMSAL